MDKFVEILKILASGQKKSCIFGAGFMGRTFSYRLLNTAGITADYYCDNNIKLHGSIVNGAQVISPFELSRLKDKCIVFISLSNERGELIRKQLKEYGFVDSDIVYADYLLMQRIIERVKKIDDVDIKSRWEDFVDDEKYLKWRFEDYLGYCLNLEFPQTFNEKIQWLKLYDRNPLYSTLVDKVQVKEYVAKKIGKNHIIPTIGVWDKPKDIDFEKLPKQFVLKCAHDSGSVVICKDTDGFDQLTAINKLTKCQERNWFYFGREWAYKNVLPRIICEEYLTNKSRDELIDYKVFCFDGEPRFLYVSSGLDNHETAFISFVSLDWKELHFRRTDYRTFAVLPPKPAHFGEMIDISKKLSFGLKFVRIDLYEINGNIYFSEFTLYPCSGFMPFKSKDNDVEIGEMLKIN